MTLRRLLRSARLGLGALGLLAASASVASAGCVINNLAELPVRYNGVRVLADAKLNGHDARLVVDSGAFASTLSEAAARKVGANPRGLSGFQIGGIGGYREAGAVALDLTLGVTTFRAEQFVVLPGEDDTNVPSALLGREFLLQHDLDFDLADGLLRFVRPVGCTDDQMVFWNKPYSEAVLEDARTDRAEIRVKTFVNGHPVLALIDSGAPFSTITTGAAERVGLDPSHAASAGLVGGLGRGQMVARVAHVNSFTIGEETIKNSKLLIADLWHYNVVPETGTRLGNAAVIADQPEMLLGADFLKAHRVLFAPSHGRIYFSYLGGPVFGVSDNSLHSVRSSSEDALPGAGSHRAPAPASRADAPSP